MQIVMHSCYRRGIRLLSSASSSSSKIKWEPTVALELNHETLYLLEKCSTRYHFKQILGHMMRTRLLLFSAISHPENLDMAILLFNYYTPCPNLFIYNTMISALSFSTTESFALYNSMLHSGIYPDKHTLLYLLKASHFISQVKQIHGHAIVSGLFSYVYLKNFLTNKYLEKGLIGIAHQVYIGMSTPDSISFNIMIVGYATEGFGLEAIEMFLEMVRLGLKPDEFTMVGLLVSCGLVRDAQADKSVRAWIERRNSSSSSNLILGNALLDMYVKCRELGFCSIRFLMHYWRRIPFHGTP